MANNKVQLADGTTIIDITDTTAVASDVAEGKYFYGADGIKREGTASPFGGVTVVETQDSHGGTIVEITGEVITLASKNITTNGTYTALSENLTGYSQVVVNVPSDDPVLQTKITTPTESQQTITPDTGYDGLSSVTVNAISSTYVGSGIDRNDSTDLSASGATITAPAGYYASDATYQVSSGNVGTPSASKGAVSNHSISVTPSVTHTAGYISAGTKTGTAVTVSASELVSGNLEITENGTGINVTNYATVSVNTPTVDVDYTRTEVCPLTTFTAPSDAAYVMLNNSKRLVDDAYYVVTYDGVEYLCTCNELYGTDRFIGDIAITWNTSNDYITPFAVEDWNNNNHPVVYPVDKTQHTIKIERLVLLNDGINLQTKTVTPSTSQQTISPDTGYDALGTVTVSGDADLVGSNILSSANIFGVQGTVVIQHYYTGSSAPSSSVGVDGDIYLQM